MLLRITKTSEYQTQKPLSQELLRRLAPVLFRLPPEELSKVFVRKQPDQRVLDTTALSVYPWTPRPSTSRKTKSTSPLSSDTPPPRRYLVFTGIVELLLLFWKKETSKEML